nr:MAG TPA: hypothetical protein [Caudoviricetes sp.]
MIRYDKKINQEINRTIKNFNQKIARLEKQQRDLILPEKITKKALKDSVYTRTELKRKLKELQRYSERGIESTLKTKTGIEISKYELVNIQKESARIKRNLTREIKKMQVAKPKVFGKVQARTFAEMGDSHYLNIVARRKALEKGKLTKLTKEEYERYKTLLFKTVKNKAYMNKIFKENYLKMLTDLGYYYDYDKDKLKLLEERLSKLSTYNFQKLFESDKSIKAILDYYPSITGTISGIDPDDIKEDVTNLYDSLINNLDDILKDYA